MQHFFRGVEDGIALAPYSPVHLLLLALFVLGLWQIGRKNSFFREAAQGDKLTKILVGVLLADQVVLYSWQIFSGYFRWDISLPLYHCRTAIWFLILGVLARKNTLLHVGMLWGTAGAIMALLVPDLYQFRFPHYTNFQFFIAHMTMGWLIFHLLWNQKERIGFTEIRSVLIVSNFYNLCLLMVNLGLRTIFPRVNYGYMLAFPAFIPIRLAVPGHFLVMALLFNTVMILIGLMCVQVSRKTRVSLAYE